MFWSEWIGRNSRRRSATVRIATHIANNIVNDGVIFMPETQFEDDNQIREVVELLVKNKIRTRANVNQGNVVFHTEDK